MVTKQKLPEKEMKEKVITTKPIPKQQEKAKAPLRELSMPDQHKKPEQVVMDKESNDSTDIFADEPEQGGGQEEEKEENLPLDVSG